MECVNADANELEKLNENLFEDIDKVIAQTFDTNIPFPYDENVYWDFDLVEMQDMHGCEQDMIIL